MIIIASKNSFIYNASTTLSVYMKFDYETTINKNFFKDVRDMFGAEYKNACKFYNSGNVKQLITYSKEILEKEFQEVLNNNIEEKHTIINQYESLTRALDDSYNNLNLSTIIKIINGMPDADNQKYNLRLIIKGLIILQVLYNIMDVITATNLDENRSYNVITEYKNDLFLKILEHMNEYAHLLDQNNEFLSENLSVILNEAHEEDKDFDDDPEEKEVDIEKFYNDDLLKNNELIDNDLFKEIDDIDSNDLDLIMDDNKSYSASNLDKYIFELYLKEVTMIRIIIEDIIDSKYSLLPNSNYIMYWLIILLMHCVNKF